MPKYLGTLRELMALGLDHNAVLPAFSQILQGVETAHLLGVTHRDLKPENILFDPSAKLFVVADFGIAHFADELLVTAVNTKASDRLANMGYSAPEQRIRGGVVDSRADIYALGQLLNEMFTKSVPEGAGHRLIANVAPSFAYLDPLVDKMRQQDPSNRPQTIGDIKKDLIARGNEYVALQTLDALKKTVVRAATPQEVEDVILVECKWDQGILHLRMNRAPEQAWIQHFHYPKTSISFASGTAPTTYRFIGDRIAINLEERNAQNAINQFKIWSSAATKKLQEEQIASARENDRLQKKTLQMEIAQAEAAAKINSQLKI